ncbi:hypothetical protein TanjilG_17679 [Lupinus angustifolius]|uniref:Uncharacterized protein n=1 Tax=Lupinus angustifolius TaxID=3871 RepID=A0A1J7HV63_LUPAN|nr:hypothetical protein TanjilG_17679 [Lupinus angustifolius]
MHIGFEVPMTYTDRDASSGSRDDVNMTDRYKRQTGNSGGGGKRGPEVAGCYSGCHAGDSCCF